MKKDFSMADKSQKQLPSASAEPANAPTDLERLMADIQKVLNGNAAVVGLLNRCLPFGEIQMNVHQARFSDIYIKVHLVSNKLPNTDHIADA